MVVVALIGVVQVYGLLAFVERSNRDMVRFLEPSNTPTCPTRSPPACGNHLRRTQRCVRACARTVSDDSSGARGESPLSGNGCSTRRHRTYCLREDGKVELANTAARRLLHATRLDRIDHLAAVSADLVVCLQKAKPGQRQMVTLRNGSGPQHISVLTTQLRLSDRNITLASFRILLQSWEPRNWRLGRI